jgi:hypothetical protein
LAYAARQGGGWWNTQSTAFVFTQWLIILKHQRNLNLDYNVKISVNGELILDKKMTKADVFEDLKFVIDGLA